MAYKVDYKIVECMQPKNDCYRKGQKHSKSGIVRHNTSAGNPNLKRYIDDPERLGKNVNGNHWNQSGTGKCVHYWIGLDRNNVVRIYHVLPDNYYCWGNAKHPSTGRTCNGTHIQYEICDDGFKSKEYFEATHKAARYLEAYLCVKYGWSEKVIVSHYESYYKLKAGSCHSDDDNWLKKFGTNMDEERAKVKKLIKEMKAKKNNKDDDVKTVTKVDKDKTNPTPQKDDSQVKSYVKGLQKSLNSLGEHLEVDSSFGPRTSEAMGRHNVKKGMKNDLVKHFQYWLKKAGFYKGELDSSYGPLMAQAVGDAQRKVGVKDDLIIGSGSAKAFMKLLK